MRLGGRSQSAAKKKLVVHVVGYGLAVLEVADEFFEFVAFPSFFYQYSKVRIEPDIETRRDPLQVGLTNVRDSPRFSFLPATDSTIEEVFRLFDELDAWIQSHLAEASLPAHRE